MESVINMFDENALEEALLLREKFGGKVSVISMGPPQVQEALRKAVAMGADEAYLLCDRALGGADVLATAYTLAQGIKKLQPVDLILCGRHAVDADTGQVGPELAERLGWPQVTPVSYTHLDVYKRQVDITGQVGSEALGFNQFSGTGGQLDFVRGAGLSKGCLLYTSRCV